MEFHGQPNISQSSEEDFFPDRNAIFFIPLSNSSKNVNEVLMYFFPIKASFLPLQFLKHLI